MRGLAILLISVCCALPCATVAADPAHRAVTTLLATYPNLHGPLHRGALLPHAARDFHANAPWHYATPDFHRPRAQHLPYFNLHAYSSPGWRTPRTLRFHDRYR